jgi:hypothetical protein
MIQAPTGELSLVLKGVDISVVALPEASKYW